MKSICLVRLSALGDVVQSLGAVQALLRARPDLDIHFVTQTEFVPLLRDEGFASVVGHERRSGLRGLMRTRRQLRALSPDCAIDLQGNWKSALVTRFSGAPVRIGVEAKARQEPASGVLLNRRIGIEDPGHPAVIATRLLREIEPGLAFERARLHASESELESVAAEVAAAGVDPSRPFTVFVATDPSDTRSWHLSAMQRQAEAESCPVLWVRGPEELHVDLPAGSHVVTHRGGQLRDLIALGLLVVKAGGRVLGPDQGAVHVLTACGAETHVFFGPQDPEETAPPGSHPWTRKDGPQCVPCRRRRCDFVEGPVCMDFTLAEASREASLRAVLTVEHDK